MHALSVRQPWAELIASGKKRIEHRNWHVRHRGDLLIVASTKRSDDDCFDEGVNPDRVAYGKAVCVVDLWKISGDLYDYHWHVRDPRRVEPTPLKGSAGIFHVDDASIRPHRVDRRAVAAKPRASASSRTARSPAGLRVVVAARDPRMVQRWSRALTEMGCRVEAVRDGLAAWSALQAQNAASVVLDVDIQGHPATEVVERMRASKDHADTPVVVAGGVTSKSQRITRVKRQAGADEIARAVQAAIDLGKTRATAE